MIAMDRGRRFQGMMFALLAAGAIGIKPDLAQGAGKTPPPAAQSKTDYAAAFT